MRPLKVLAAALALSLLAAPAMAEARPAKPPAAAKAAKAGKAGKAGKARKGKQGQGKADTAKREARVLAAMKKQGIDEARAKRVIEVMKKYRTERQPVHAEVKKQREALRALSQSDSKDQAAYKVSIDAIEAQKAKLTEIQARQVTEVRSILTPSEQAKVLRMLNNAHGKRGAGKAPKGKTASGANAKLQNGTGNDVS